MSDRTMNVLNLNILSVKEMTAMLAGNDCPMIDSLTWVTEVIAN